MEDHITKSVVGQPEAVTAVSDCLRLARAGLHKHDRPMGVLLFLGPTGTRPLDGSAPPATIPPSHPVCVCVCVCVCVHGWGRGRRRQNAAGQGAERLHVQ